VVARFTNSGTGDHLSCILGAWWYAVRTDRTLCTNWRGSRFNPNSQTNGLFRYFSPTHEAGSVTVICDDAVCSLTFPDSCFPEKWSEERLYGIDHGLHTADETQEVACVVA